MTESNIPLSKSLLTRLLLFSFETSLTYATFIFYSSAFFILVPAYNLSVTWTTAVAYMYVAVEICITVWIGYYGDRIVSRFGRRKPPVLIGYLIICVSVVLMSQLSVANLFGTGGNDGFDDDSIHSWLVSGDDGSDGSNATLEVWFLFCQIVAAVGLTLFQIPFNSWFYESSSDLADYTTIRLWCLNLGDCTGYLLAIYTLYSLPRIALQLAVLSLIGLGLPLLALLLYKVHNRVVRVTEAGEVADPSPGDGRTDHASKEIASAKPIKAQKSAPEHMLPAIRRLLQSDPEFRKLLFNEILLNTGSGIGSEFISFSPYILFPAVRHYQDLIKLATIFYLATFILTGVLTAVAKPVWLEYYKIDKIDLYKRMIVVFVFGCGISFCLNVPGLITEASPGVNIGVDDDVPVSDAASHAAMILIYTYMGIQVCLAALVNTATNVSSLLTRDLIRFAEFRTGRNQYNLYQAALSIPPRILVGFLIAIPQIIFYSSGYRVRDYDYSAESTGGDDGTLVNDDLIDHKWTWTAASYYEIVFFQCILAAILAIISYKVIDSYSITQPISDKVDCVLADRQKRSKVEDERSNRSQDGPLEMPLLDSSTNLPWLKISDSPRKMKLVNVNGNDLRENENLLEPEIELFYHLSRSEIYAMSSPEAWRSVPFSAKRTKEGSIEQRKRMTSPSLSNVNVEDSSGMSSESARVGESGHWVEAFEPLDSVFRSTSGEKGPVFNMDSGAMRSSTSDTSLSSGTGKIYLHRNITLETLALCHRLSLFVFGPAAIGILLYANYEQIWHRNNSPYLPLLVNLLCFVCFYVFYEMLRSPVYSELLRVLRFGPAEDFDCRSRSGSSVSVQDGTKYVDGINAAGSNTLKQALERMANHMLYRDESLKEFIKRSREEKAVANASVPASLCEMDEDPLECISIDYNPAQRRVVPVDNPSGGSDDQEFRDELGVVHEFSTQHYGGAGTLKQRNHDKNRAKDAFLVTTSSGNRFIYFTFRDMTRLWGGYGWTYLGLLVLAAVGVLFILVI